MRLPIDSELMSSEPGQLDTDRTCESDVDDMMSKHMKSKQIAFNKAEENISEAQKRQETYD